MVLVQGLSGSYSLDVGLGMSSEDLTWPGGSASEKFIQMGESLCWLLARGISSSPNGSLQGLLECPHKMAGFPSE